MKSKTITVMTVDTDRTSMLVFRDGFMETLTLADVARLLDDGFEFVPNGGWSK